MKIYKRTYSNDVTTQKLKKRAMFVRISPVMYLSVIVKERKFNKLKIIKIIHEKQLGTKH